MAEEDPVAGGLQHGGERGRERPPEARLEGRDLVVRHGAEAQVLRRMALDAREEGAHHPPTLSITAPRCWYSFTLYWILRGEI